MASPPIRSKLRSRGETRLGPNNARDDCSRCDRRSFTSKKIGPATHLELRSHTFATHDELRLATLSDPSAEPMDVPKTKVTVTTPAIVTFDRHPIIKNTAAIAMSKSKHPHPPVRDNGPVPAANDNDRLLRLHQVLELIPISRASFYAGIRKGIYPRPLRLGGRSVAWRLSSILAIVENGTGH